MKQKYSYRECYHILKIKPGCSWDVLRKSYKQQIQKWHPDRFENSSPQKEAATHKIKLLNRAYHQFSQYYRKNGSLPVIEHLAPAARNIAGSQVKSEPLNADTIQKSYRSLTPKNHRTKSQSFIFLAIISITFIYILVEYTPVNNPPQQPQKTVFYNNPILNQQEPQHSTYNVLAPEKSAPLPNNTESLDSLTNTNKNQTDSQSTQVDDSENYFTYGSSIGNVIHIQGTPDKVEDDVWLYGDSKVYFSEGKVIKWERRQGTHLKAKAIFNDQ
ncbi:MAG: J domain-containing protein [Gammaproteobacteria bacterium]|nr:J domain-containing protein [Gammaproteobacteria bacterium]